MIARDPLTGNVKCVEVKANSSRLSPDQAKGGQEFVTDRLNKAIEQKGHYRVPPNSPELKANAEKAQRWMDEAPNIDYEVHQVPIDNQTGITGTPKVRPWDPK